MPVVKKYDKNYDFKFEKKDKNREIYYFFYLKDNICVKMENYINADNKTHQFAIRESDDNTLEFWREDIESWWMWNEDIRKAYLDYVVEKELLNDER